MKDWRRKYQVLFVTLISLWVLISPTYCLFYSLDKIDVFRRLHWEDPVQEDLLADVQQELVGVGWIFCAVIFDQGNEVSNTFPDLSVNPLSTEKVPILRC